MSYDIPNSLSSGDPEFLDKFLKAPGKDVFTLSPLLILNEDGVGIGYDYSYLDGIEDFEGFEFEEDDELEITNEIETTDEEEEGDLSIVLMPGSGENAEYNIVDRGDGYAEAVVSSRSKSSSLARADTGDSDVDLGSLSRIPSISETAESTSETAESTSSSTLDVLPTQDPVSASGKRQRARILRVKTSEELSPTVSVNSSSVVPVDSVVQGGVSSQSSNTDKNSNTDEKS
ncbi:hypothetical protein, partial [Bartonella sp. CL74QHWL]|uniref:hypothetical protein n=1 Tax=Bartonella sp. CL74QHWL TaxID=3243541 RepID=UPI0035D03329